MVVRGESEVRFACSNPNLCAETTPGLYTFSSLTPTSCHLCYAVLHRSLPLLCSMKLCTFPTHGRLVPRQERRAEHGYRSNVAWVFEAQRCLGCSIAMRSCVTAPLQKGKKAKNERRKKGIENSCFFRHTLTALSLSDTHTVKGGVRAWCVSGVWEKSGLHDVLYLLFLVPLGLRAAFPRTHDGWTGGWDGTAERGTSPAAEAAGVDLARSNPPSLPLSTARTVPFTECIHSECSSHPSVQHCIQRQPHPERQCCVGDRVSRSR